MTLDVLLVEDDDLDREMIRRALLASDVDLRVHEASTVSAARDALGRSGFDCAIVDISLPDGDGLEIVSAAPATAFVVLTGAIDSPAREALNRGAQDYLLKTHIDPYWLGRSVEYAIERKRLQLYQRETEHQDRLASLGQLAASVAHEINNPTAFVTAHLEAVKNVLPQWRSRSWLSEEANDELAQVLSDCTEGLQRVAQIVRQLSGFARRPEEEEEVVAVDLADVVTWALALTKTQLSHAARVDEDITSCPTFLGRPGGLSQVITNLLVNAAQAVESVTRERVIRVSVGVSGDHIVACVEDSGPGLSPTAAQRAFDPFFTTKGQSQGTGLGLSVAKAIVHEHSGELLLERSDLGGLKAMVRLPLENKLVSDVVSAPQTSTKESRALTVVIVDDEPALRRAYQRLLRPHLVHAMDATEAASWLQDEVNAQTVDAVVCDLMMPGLDGRALYKLVSTSQSRLLGRFVFCSGGVFQADLGEFLHEVEGKGAPILMKPVSRDGLIEAIMQVAG